MIGVFVSLCVISCVEIHFSTMTDLGSPYLVRHLYRIALGLVLFTIVLLVDYRVWLSKILAVYVLTLLVLMLVLFLGVEIHASKSWVRLAGITFQPSELAKLVVVMTLAKFLGESPEKYLKPGMVLVTGLVALIPAGLIVLQRDLGTAILILPVFFGMLMVGGIRKKVILAAGLAMALILAGSWFVLRDYQRARIMVVIDPELDPRGTGYQTMQSVIAIGSGSLTGRGFGNGSQGALGFLPERHTDFIFSVIGEEMGFLGAAFVLALYAVLLLRILRVALETTDKTALYACVGIATLYSVHLIVNVGMALGLLPVIGIPLPPLSYGGSSVVTMFIALALVNNFRIHRYLV